MGNKSKTNGAKQSVKWAQRRDMSKARQPKSWTQWGGMAAPSLVGLQSVRITGGHAIANLSPLSRVNRQMHVTESVRVVWNSSKAGTLRNAKPLNSHTGV